MLTTYYSAYLLFTRELTCPLLYIVIVDSLADSTALSRRRSSRSQKDPLPALPPQVPDLPTHHVTNKPTSQPRKISMRRKLYSEGRTKSVVVSIELITE